MKFVGTDDVREWYLQAKDLAEFTHTIGRADSRDDDDVGRALDLPAHLEFTIEQLAKGTDGPIGHNAFDSIPFFSLCRGLLLPLSNMLPERATQLFGITIKPTTESNADLARRFLMKDCGLSLMQKVACLLGDPFLGK